MPKRTTTARHLLIVDRDSRLRIVPGSFRSRRHRVLAKGTKRELLDALRRAADALSPRALSRYDQVFLEVGGLLLSESATLSIARDGKQVIGENITPAMIGAEAQMEAWKVDGRRVTARLIFGETGEMLVTKGRIRSLSVTGGIGHAALSFDLRG